MLYCVKLKHIAMIKDPATKVSRINDIGAM